uniref:Exoribonuclease phosphorolytic domain-containing protein n=1 Tax=Felis catus TaxID=9685 RepID=A0ABI7VU49_FELCA
MAGLELLSDQGYRVDGRRAGELRKIQARMGVFAQADGSAYIEQGNTKALAVVYGPHERDRAWTGEGQRERETESEAGSRL